MLPRIALAMPPPSEPGPGVGWVKSVGDRPFTPSTISISRIEPSTAAPTRVAIRQDRRSSRSATCRPGRTRTVSGAAIWAPVSGFLAFIGRSSGDLDAAHEQAGDDEDDEGDDEEDAAERHQGVELHAVSLVELVGDARGDGGAWIKDRAREPIGVPDHEGDRH